MQRLQHIEMLCVANVRKARQWFKYFRKVCARRLAGNRTMGMFTAL